MTNASSAPITEGVKYAGSKLRLIPYICDVVGTLPDVGTVLDGFAGTTRVAQALARMGYAVCANDQALWAEVFGRCYLVADRPDAFYQEILDHLNSLPGRDGWFTAHYGGAGPEGKRPFQVHNTRRLDAIRDEIDTLGLTWDDKCVVLTSLIRALDAVDNTLGHFASYLSGWSARSHNKMKLVLPRRVAHEGQHRVSRADVFSAIANPCDLMYFDPPYGSNNEKMPSSRVRYESYYHIWKTVILNDQPAVFGRAARREDSRDALSTSVFEEYRRDEASGRHVAMLAIDRLIREARAHYVLLSYSSGGRATKAELHDILTSHGRIVSAREVDYRKNVMSAFRWTNAWVNDYGTNREFLFLLEK